jgi:hypothetical protein
LLASEIAKQAPRSRLPFSDDDEEAVIGKIIALTETAVYGPHDRQFPDDSIRKMR